MSNGIPFATLSVESAKATVEIPIQYAVMVDGKVIALLLPDEVERAYKRFQEMAERRAAHIRKLTGE